MHWIVNSSLARELGYDAIMHAIIRRSLPHTIVRKPPIVDFLIDERGEPIQLDIPGPVFVVGTTSMGAVSENHGWNPGYIDAPNFDDCLAHWGDLMLNADSLTGRIDEIVPPASGLFFTRPVEDTKSIEGRITDAAKFEEWRGRVLKIKGFTTIPPETMLQIAPLKEIWAEYRCLMIGGRFVTGSRYKTGETVAYSPDVGPMIVDFANECASIWNPRPAYALDIAHTPEGLKIIETNSICSAGFYASDLDAFVAAIERLHEEGGFQRPEEPGA